MTKVKVELLDVYCADTEDITAADDFYLVGALVGGGNTKPILTRPIKINDRQTKQFRPEDSVLFEGEIPPGESIKGGLKAYDLDKEKDWNKYGDAVKQISNAVSSALAEARPQAGIAGTILSAATTGVDILGSVPGDDLLGVIELEISATGPSHEERAWKMRSTDHRWYNWDYTLRYRISRS